MSQLDDKGRCCGRKPLVYRGAYAIGGPHRFCPRCDRSYALDTDEQLENFAWQRNPSSSDWEPRKAAK